MKPQKMLLKAGVTLNNLSNYKFLEGHDNVALAVLAGDYDAGAVKEETFQKYAPKGLRSLVNLPSVYDHIFVTSAKLTPALVDNLRSIFLKMNETPEGKKIMASIHPGMTSLASPKDSEYDNLRAIMSLNKTTNQH